MKIPKGSHYFDFLPVEIITKIISYLPKEAVARVGLTEKRLYVIAMQALFKATVQEQEEAYREVGPLLEAKEVQEKVQQFLEKYQIGNGSDGGLPSMEMVRIQLTMDQHCQRSVLEERFKKLGYERAAD